MATVAGGAARPRVAIAAMSEFGFAAPVAGGTELAFLHENFFDQAARDSHEGGWLPTFVKLAHFLESATA